jgi:hypothetical protein
MIKSLFVVAAAMIAAPVLAQAPAERPMCSAKVTDGCQQTAAQQARAMSGAQADARDARNGGKWTPDGTNSAAAANQKATARKAAAKK